MDSFKIKPGSIVILDTSSARGGVTYGGQDRSVRCPSCGYEFARRAKLRGDSRATVCPSCGSAAEESEVLRKRAVDHKVFVKDGNNLVQSDVRCILRAHCTHTQLGWVCPKSELPAVKAAYAEVARKASDFNASAAAAGSAIRVTVGFVPLGIEVDNVEAAAFLAATVRDVCADMIAALSAGNRPALASLARKAKNLDRLAVGMQRNAILYAVENFKEARAALNAAAKECGLKDESRDKDTGAPVGKLAVALSKVGPTLDVEAIEACIDMFTPDEVDGDRAALA